MDNNEDQIAELRKKVEQLQQELHREKKKNEILHQHNLELIQEIEMVRSDFGDGSR